MVDKNKKFLILGSYGRCGKFLVDLMDKNGYKNLLYPTSKACNLLDPFSCEAYFRVNKPDYVISLAAKTTNILLCNEHPVNICRDTLQMNISVLDLCKKYEVEKLLNVVCSCSYPAGKDLLREEDFFSGSPHESVLAHGLAKRMVYYLGRAYATQYKMNVVTVALNNIFGGADWSRPTSLKFLDSLIVKIVEAKLTKNKYVYIWGSGTPLRECHWVGNAAADILAIFEQWISPDLINAGTGTDMSIMEWTNLIASLTKYKGEFILQPEKPDGQQKKLFDVSLLTNNIARYEQKNLNDSLIDTIDSYKKWRKNNAKY